nr:ribonuclease H-like domain-containing protein [Tanacetum cinerariifolium]
MTLHDPTSGNWNIDIGASFHLSDAIYSLSDVFDMCIYPSVSVGDAYSIPITNSGHSILPTPHRPLHLNNVLITSNIVKNLISIRKFDRDNNCTLEFDAFGFSVKDFITRRVLLYCDTTGDLYPVMKPFTILHAFLTSQYIWHQYLGHPGSEVLHHLLYSNSISCAKEKAPVLCHACQLGKHVRLLRYKDRLVANGNTQLEGIDVDETFSLVVKPGTIRTVLSLATSRHWLVHQLDVKNAFLHGDLSETVYMHRPLGFRGSTHPNYVCLLERQRAYTGYLLLYIDDIVLTASSERKYADEILERAHMVNCNPNWTPVDTESKLEDDGDLVSDSVSRAFY